MRKSIKAAIVVAAVFALSAMLMAQSNNAQDQNQHHSRFSKLAVWRHHKDNKDTKMKANSAPKAQSAAQPQLTATAARPRPVKHISDMDEDSTPKPMAKSAKAPAHAANAKQSHVKLASSKAPAGHSMKAQPAMHHAAQKSSAQSTAKAKTAQKKKSGQHADNSKDKKPA